LRAQEGDYTEKARLTTVLTVVALAILVVTPAAVMGARPVKQVDWTSKVAEKLDMYYAERIIDDICSMGDSAMGFRGAGGPADVEAAEYIASEMDAIGLTEVALEAVPVDSWEFRSAYLEVPELGTMLAASFGGFPGTDDQSTDELEVIEKEIVWVGNGYDSDYEGKDVEGKIVLANWIGYDYWVDSMAFGAMEHNVAGMVVTTIDSNVGQSPNAISCHDGLYVPGFPPLISISKENALLIIDQLETGAEPLVVTMYSDIVKGSHMDGVSFGYNVVGYLPGKNWGTDADEYVIIGPHHDAWFQGAMDDTSGVAAMLVIAKAMKETMDEDGWAPERTMIFTSHTGEEYGIDDTYFDWCYGANYQIINEHPEWVGKSVAYLCLELMGMAGEPVYVNCVPELYSFVRQTFAKNTKNMPYGWEADPKVHTWADQWTFSAAGVPGIEFATTSDAWDTYVYHTQVDAPSIIDYTYLHQLFVLLTDMSVKLMTTPVAPYNYQVLAGQLEEVLTVADEFNVTRLDEIYAEYGVGTDNLQALLDQVTEFSDKVVALQTALKSVSVSAAHDVNTQLMAISGTLGQSLIAIGVWEQDWFPYQQPINDVYHAYDALQVLKTATWNDQVTDAIWELNWVGLVWYYDYDSYANYLDQRDRLTGDRTASWGLQTHLQLAVDIWPEYDALWELVNTKTVSQENLAPIIASLEAKMVDVSMAQLENSFVLMTDALDEANGQIDALMMDL
jgi:Iap family predicted aminopeptidase